MSGTEIFYFIAVGWFTFVCLRIAVLIRRFIVFPRGYGRVPNVSLHDLAVSAEARDEDLPGFRIVIPAYQEALVIDGTLRRVAGQNYPLTHFGLLVVTYADEPVVPDTESTFAVAQRTAEDLNARAGREFIRILSVPAGFDGSFPGNLESETRSIGKARGLNFALRSIHEENERNERAFYIGRMVRLGQDQRMDTALEKLESAVAEGPTEELEAACLCFDPTLPGYVGPCTLSEQLIRAFACLKGIVGQPGGQGPGAARLAAFVEREAPRFFYRVDAPPGASVTHPMAALEVMAGRQFLHRVMGRVEAQPAAWLDARSREIEAQMHAERPRLAKKIGASRDGEEVYQLARQLEPRWLAVYDADADPPVELFRHLAARILDDPSVMGFQGPVAPIANYGAVHPLCKLGGLWMGFWHSTGYPVLMARAGWAHVLAGTNWCFRIEGSRRDGRLEYAPFYDEARREFLLSFDPRQLTEDLEVAVRIFSEWSVNAEWHPLLEYEQVPETPRAMIVQRRRWTLGTLQTLAYILRSRVPLLQKLKYALLPLDIVFSGSGPLVTVALWLLVYSGDLLSNRVLMVWSIVLTFGNLVYVLPYLLAHQRFVIGFRRTVGFDYVLHEGPGVVAAVRDQMASGAITVAEAHLLRDISSLLESGQGAGGFIGRYLAERSLEDGDEAAVRAHMRGTPAALRREDVQGLARALADLAERSWGARKATAPSPGRLEPMLSQLKAALEKAATRGRWRQRQRLERRQIWLWAFVYLFWQLIPYYGGLMAWLFGGNTRTWVKTPRTRKTNVPSPE